MKNNQRKFGAFTGVFTPSILTILGVIMYMRLGWVVGQSGLLTSIVIILIAHIISVTTGLSISSIATDKKIRTGGIYYILSRSLGLPMGGAIGITLFIGTALSIALYIVGFAENFLGIEAIRQTLGLGATLTDIRIVGTVVIAVLAVIALVSTSLVLKMQYVVLTAIGLSLLSVIAGLIFNTSFHTEQIALFPISGGVSPEIIFGVFFPAVTGFTVGVSMSGDLKEPNKSIPRGTMGSILVGLAVYLALAILFGIYLDRELLVNDKNFLMKVALYSPLVIAGIWGATLSSALGGILGAPRILQAIARDRLVSQVFRKGSGASDEPRNALIFSLIIAEAGILIGDLNIIAGIVTMFYISAYGFINLAYALEKWASSDFRPSFSMPVWVGVAGAVASFAVMFKLDTLAMIIALLIMFGIYAFLKRKQLQLDLGDVWQSVWSTLIRDSLHRMDMKDLEDRNWRPNIILFSGNKGVRDHLIAFGKSLVGQHGFLSNFELIEQRDKSSVLPKPQQSVKTIDSVELEGVFNRKEYSDDIYKSIVSVSKHYGFAGVEPNTVLLGWGRHSSNPARFADTIKQLTRLDLNILMIDYDKQQGYGNYKRIDIWWRGSNNNGQLALSLVRFLWLSNDWRNTNVRLLIVNYNNDQKKQIERKVQDILSTMRLRATIKIINNEIEKRPFLDIIENESASTDMTFLGIPEIESGKEEQFVENINKICSKLNTVVLVRASSAFKAIDLNIDSSPKKLKEKIEPVIKESHDESSGLSLSHPELEHALNRVLSEVGDTADYINEEILLRLFNYQDELLQKYHEEFKTLTEKTYEAIKTESPDIHTFHHQFLFNISKLFHDLKIEHSDIQQDLLEEVNQYSSQRFDEIIKSQAEIITIFRPWEDYKSSDGDTASQKLYKSYKRLIHSKKHPVKEKITLRELIKNHLHAQQQEAEMRLLKQWSEINTHFLVELMSVIHEGAAALVALENSSEINGDTLKKAIGEVENIITKTHELSKASYKRLSAYFKREMLAVAGPLQDTLNAMPVNRSIPDLPRSYSQKKEKLAVMPSQWKNRQLLLFNLLHLEVVLFSFSEKIRILLEDTSAEINQVIEEHFTDSFKKLLKLLSKKNINNTEFKTFIEEQGFSANRVKVELRNVTDNALRRIRHSENSFPESLLMISEETYAKLDKDQEDFEQVEILVRQLADFLVQKNLVAPLQEKMLEMGKKLESISARSQEYVKWLSFHLVGEEEEKDFINEKQINEDPKRLTQNLKDELAYVAEQQKILTTHISELKTQLDNSLSVDNFMRSIKEMRQYVREMEQKERMHQFRTFIKRNRSRLKKSIDAFIFSKSKKIVERHSKTQPNTPATTQDFLMLRKDVAPDTSQLNEIPFYYQQLFSRKQYYLNELWTGRAREIQTAKEAYEDYSSGFYGGLLVSGDRFSGKSFFSQYIAKMLATEGKVYTLYAPYAGSLSTAHFKSQLQKATDIYGSYEEIFNKIPEKSILIIDDLELWWENTENGNRVIDQLIFLMERYSSKCFFIVSLNSDTHHKMHENRNLDAIFLRIIRMSPMDSQSIRDAILKRHHSSNLSYKISGPGTAAGKSIRDAQIFNAVFYFSGGNIGLALKTWLGAIVSSDQDSITLKEPKTPDLSRFSNVEQDWVALIEQVLLHKRLTLPRMMRISGESQAKVLKKINMLKRAGVLTEQNDGVYEIDSYLYYWIQRIIKKKN